MVKVGVGLREINAHHFNVLLSDKNKFVCVREAHKDEERCASILMNTSEEDDLNVSVKTQPVGKQSEVEEMFFTQSDVFYCGCYKGDP